MGIITIVKTLTNSNYYGKKFYRTGLEGETAVKSSF
jgi:hypothetical protein